MITNSFLFNIFASGPESFISQHVESFRMFRNLKIVNTDSIFPVVYTGAGINEGFANWGPKLRTGFLLKSMAEQDSAGEPLSRIKDQEIKILGFPLNCSSVRRRNVLLFMGLFVKFSY